MDRWEYEAYIYDWGSSALEIRRSGQRQDLSWTGMWAYFNGLGGEGWELVSATSVSDARWGNAENNTTRMLFVFKRRKTDRLAAEPAPVETA